MDALVTSIESLLRQGQEEQAREKLEALRTDGCESADLHVRVADLCQELGQDTRLVVELNRAFALAPDRLELLRRLGQVHTDGGRYKRALKCWKVLTERSPSDVEAWEELGAALASLERHEEARQVYEQAEQATGDKRFQALARERPAAVREATVDEPDEAVVARFTHLFSGREGVYARQWANPQGETGYSPIHEPFTPQVVRGHLLGRHTVGNYVLRVDNTVNFAAIDLDLPRDFLTRATQKEAFERLRELRVYALKMCLESGLILYLEESGFKGFHIWFLFAQPVPARVARRLATAVAKKAGPPPAGVGIEIFPKQVEVPPDGLGNLIKLPLGVHRVTGRRGEFLDELGLPIEKPYSWILELRTIEMDEIRAYLERVSEPDPEPEESLAPGQPAQSASARAAFFDYHLDSDLTTQNVLARCCVLRALAEKALYHNQLNHDEARVVIHTLGHLETGPQAVNVLLRKAPELDASLYLKSRLRGNPMSCAKIRSRLPQVTSHLPCRCEFDLESGLYPNPLLHLQSRVQASATLQFRTLVEDYLRSGKELREASERHAVYTHRLSEWFDQAGTEELKTSLGMLRRIRSEDGQVSFSLEM